MQIPNPSVSHFPSSPLATTSLFPELLYIIRSLRKTRHRLTQSKNLWVTEAKAVSGAEKSPKVLVQRLSCQLIIRSYLIICSKSQILSALGGLGRFGFHGLFSWKIPRLLGLMGIFQVHSLWGEKTGRRREEKKQGNNFVNPDSCLLCLLGFLN